MGAPFRQFVLKVYGRCDLACDHCYVYEHADRSWRDKPRGMSERTARQVVARIAEHVKSHGLSGVDVTLHGGEPLLAGVSGLGMIVDELRGALDPLCELRLRIHTNGVRLDEEFCELFASRTVKVGISIDGDRAANDLHRRHADGRSSYDEVLRALELLRRPRYRHLYSGLLCTVDVGSDPIAVYEALRALEPPRVDLLLPHATHDHPPKGRPGDHGAWMIKIFDRWVSDGRPMGIRLFDSILRGHRGEPSLTEAIGLEPSDLVVIETDGTLEQADSLKTAFDGAPATGLTVDSLDEATAHPGILARRAGLQGLSGTCVRCPVVKICGGGLYAHRHSAANGFANPSVYCADLLRLITHVTSWAERGSHRLPARLLDELSSGYGSAAAIRALAEAELSINRGLLKAVHQSDPGRFDEPWHALGRLEATHPDILTDLLMHPYFRVWALHYLATPSPEISGYLVALAAAGQVRAGAASDVDAYLPTVGRASEPTRELDVEGLRIRLEDLDPWRDCHQWPLAPRLPAEEVEAWRSQLGDAFRLLRAEHPEHARAIAAGLTTITPLLPGERDRSSTARHAFGAIAVARPATAATLAKLLMHEFQHVKLGAILDLFDLLTKPPQEEPRYRVAWRQDPRPLEAVLQGTYAHIAVADFWRKRSDEFARWHQATLEGVATLLESDRLTPLGERFVVNMRRTLESWP